MKTLILTEKPSVARDFSLALNCEGPRQDGFIEGEHYIITWAIGHLLAPYDPEDYNPIYKKWTLNSLPIIPLEFKFKPQLKTKKQLDIIKKILKRKDIDKLIVATDAGREGELIARLILNESKSNLRSYRFWTSAALTREVIHKEIKNLKPLKEYDRLYIAGQARQKADWLVGMNLSRLATLKLNDLFSIGRVQTAVLSLIVERKNERENFISADYFELKSDFKFKNGIVEGYWFDPNKKEEERRLPERDFFDKLQKSLLHTNGKIILIKENEKINFPQGLYSLTELQRQGNIQFGFSASKTLEIAQNLYEKYKCLSYPRTDSKVMATSSLELIKNLVYKFKNLYPEHFDKFSEGKVSLQNKILFDDNKLTDHHGLIPLNNFTGDVNSAEGKIYHLVLKRFISNFLKDYKYIETTVEIECANNYFKTKGKKIIEIGFKILEGNEKEKSLPNLSLGELGVLVKSEIESKKTMPPPEYTEASLLYDMTNPARLVSENDLKKIFRTEVGLGTQATRAQIIETLLKRNYVERIEKNLKPTKKGIFLIGHLNKMPKTRELTSVSQTAKLEQSLQNMAQGEEDDGFFLSNVYEFIKMATAEWKGLAEIKKIETPPGKEAQKTFGKCPICQAEVRDYPKSYSCTRWRDGCAFTIWKTVANKKLTDSHIKKLMADKKTNLIKGFKSKSGKPFHAYLIINKDGKVEFEFA